jgi:outer membrane protein OmpA-like peptidoglycan-associated protein
MAPGLFNTYKEGEKVKYSAQLYDTSNTEKKVVIPNGEYTLWYNVSRDNRKGIPDFTHNPDSISLIEYIIPSIMKQYSIKKLKVIYQSVNSESSFYYWLQKIKKSKVFNSSQNYQVDYYSFKGQFASIGLGLNEKLSLISPDGTLLTSSSHISGLGKPKEKIKGKTIRAKLLTENLGVKRPLINTTVYIMEGNATDEALAETTTDKYGDFEINVPEKKMDYKLKAMPDDKISNVILATQSGKEISKFVKTSLGFDYKLLDIDIVRLSEVEVEVDITTMFKKMSTGSTAEVNISENINYASARFDLDNNAKMILDKVVSILKENPKVKVEVISHTDARGEDNANLILSQKRSMSVLDYLASQGVDKSRLKATGKGESSIRNRCINGVDCSDKEHEYNRRTEFSFTK